MKQQEYVFLRFILSTYKIISVKNENAFLENFLISQEFLNISWKRKLKK